MNDLSVVEKCTEKMKKDLEKLGRTVSRLDDDLKNSKISKSNYDKERKDAQNRIVETEKMIRQNKDVINKLNNGEPLSNGDRKLIDTCRRSIKINI